MEEAEMYVLRQQNTVAKYIANRSILELWLAAERRPGDGVTRRWWYQSRIKFRKQDGRFAENPGEAEGGYGVNMVEVESQGAA